MKFLIGFTLVAIAAANGNQLIASRYLPTYQNANNVQGQVSPSSEFRPSFTIPRQHSLSAPLQHTFGGHPQTSFTSPTAAGGSALRYLTPFLQSSYGLPASANNQLPSSIYPSPLAQQAGVAVNLPVSFISRSSSYGNAALQRDASSPSSARSGSNIHSGQIPARSRADATLSSNENNFYVPPASNSVMQSIAQQITIPSYASGLLDLSQPAQYRSNSDVDTTYAANGGYDYRRNKVIRN